MTQKNDNLHWFIAYVRTCCERVSKDCFAKLGYECYLPVRKEVHRWSDRNKTVERMVLPHMIFVRTTEKGRVDSLRTNPYVTGYMSKRMGPYSPAVVPDAEMETFMSMVDNGYGKVAVTEEALAPGDRVFVVSGPLAGRECELVSVEGKKCLASRLGILGTAVVEISLDSVRKIA